MSTGLKRGHENIALVSPVSVPYQRKTDKPGSYFIGTALRQMLEQVSLSKSDCDGLLTSSFSIAPDTTVSLAEIFGMSCNWVEQVPFGGAAGAIGLRRAARAVENGDAEIVACIGGDTFLPELFADLLGRFTNATADAVTPYAAGGANLPFAMLTRIYMSTFGVPREGFGKLCILQRQNATRYEQSLLKSTLTMEAYLAAKVIAEPLGLFDCVMPCAGAEGYLVMTEARALALGAPHVILRSSAERHNASRETTSMPLTFGWNEFRDDLYNAADIGPDEIDILQVYDDYPVMALRQIEELGVCKDGEASHHITEQGFQPRKGQTVHLNTSGGMLSSGQAGYAGGFMGTVEALRQLTGQGLGNQLENVRTALISGFGMINYDRGLCTAAAILERGKV